MLIVLLVGGFAWYSTTADFQSRVGSRIVSVLEDATGGRVEVAASTSASGIWRPRSTAL